MNLLSFHQVNDESLVGVTHRQAAEVLLSPVERVCLHIHRASDPNWASQHSLPSSPSMDEGGLREESFPALQEPEAVTEESLDQPPPLQAPLELAGEGESEGETNL